MSSSHSSNGNENETAKGITRISVSGYKSLYDECSIEIRPLTILAGANSSGKSSIIQPLLLMKQTLEATYDPGALLLNGANVKFTSAEQLFSHLPGKERIRRFAIGIVIENNQSVKNIFTKIPRQPIDLQEMIVEDNKSKVSLSTDTLPGDIINILPEQHSRFYKILKESDVLQEKISFIISRNRCFLEFVLFDLINQKKMMDLSPLINAIIPDYTELFGRHIRKVIHIPGLRGNPERNYKTTAVGDEFPGTFDNYVASIINYWQKSRDKRLKELSKGLEIIGLTCKVQAKQLDDTQVELRVARLLRNSDNEKDMVSIADVGFGVSQTLPVLVALLVAEPGQLVYIEQPEIHLHPRAQVAMAEILANAAKRGVKVVVETHSDRLILAIQSLVAEGNLSPDLVKLHWFIRQEDGITKINSADLDETGAFGDWPEDFGDVSLQLENRYLSAAEARLMQGIHGE
ncbi:AAA family ATPase [Anabaena subtropica]|uniref:AAA family ATPase n=1 Tax=Anabaena subtropica FACHB-260 TaxID=2692884 RepID=A0ABR8CSM6_9NOST|nr:AAA family ATPase [Anabaena subtropica]MBD2346192.1 AAA family ATPase [Anabaena subtropica FACHB-260]